MKYLLTLLLCFARTSALCTTNADCPSSYCSNDPTKTAPYFCRATSVEVLTKTANPVAADRAADPLAPAAAADAEWVEAFLKRYQQIVAAVSIPVGFFFAFAGYKYFSVTLFLSAACIAGFVSFTLIDYYQPSVQTSKPYVVMLVSSILAMSSGCVVMKLRTLGIFVAGALGGGKLTFSFVNFPLCVNFTDNSFFLFLSLFLFLESASGAIMLNVTVLNKLPAPTAMPGINLYASMVVLGILGGVMALKLERIILIVSTSLAGNVGFVVGIAHFDGDASAFILGFDFINPNTHKVTHDVWVWAYAVVFLLMVMISTIVQFKTTRDRNKIDEDMQYETGYENSLLYSDSLQQTRPVFVDRVRGYTTAV